MININYTTTPDYSFLNPPQSVPVKALLNTVLIPTNILVSPKIIPSDIISFIKDGKTIKQKVALDSGLINIDNNSYYYFYIAPGFVLDHDSSITDIIIDNQTIPLVHFFDPSPRAKLINGLLILSDNFNYIFNNIPYGIVSINNKNIFTHIYKYQNKLNYYQANTNNSILYILGSENSILLSEINQINNTIFIKPLHSSNYPLGSLSLSVEGVSNITCKINNNSYFINNTTQVGYLPHGQYNIEFYNNNNLLHINSINGHEYNSTNFNIWINKIDYKDNYGASSLQSFYEISKPITDHSNLLINLYPFNTSFKLTGPNHFEKKFNNGYQIIKNIIPGEYNINFNDTNDKILVIKNDNSYYSNI